MPQPDVVAVTREHPGWPALVAHIERVGQTRWAGLADPSSDRHYLAVFVDDKVTGHISLLAGDILLPAPPESDEPPLPLTFAGRPLRETLVETFAVEAPFQRRGIGRALQVAALELTRRLGCYQMRSWSTPDKVENYELKLALGFAAHPGLYQAGDGRWYRGVYFVKTVHEPPAEDGT